MTEEEKIKLEVLDWINQNRSQLPLNVGTWQVHVQKQDTSKILPITLGKYEAELNFTQPFYKPYSKMFLLKNDK